ncbi:MAG: DNA translocase FtsK 4TM domain-containing protein [Verrucomicrobiota bacterium]
MARGESEQEARTHPWGDLKAWLLMFVALVLLVALASYDRRDLSANAVPANATPHNFMGTFGAHLASVLFFALGAAAFTLPVLAFGLGLAGLMPALAYLRSWRSALGIVALLLAGTGLLDLFSPSLPPLGVRHESLSAGGALGYLLNAAVFRRFFNPQGASLFYGVLYLVGLLFLTDFRLVDWVTQVFRREPRNDQERMAAEQAALRKQEKDLLRKQRDLARAMGEAEPKASPASKAREAHEEAVAPAPSRKTAPRTDADAATPRNDKAQEDPATTTPAAAHSFPEPTVRDLSVPAPRPPAKVLGVGDVIRADEISQPGASIHPLDDPGEGGTEAKPRRRSVTDMVLGRAQAGGGGGQQVAEASDGKAAEAEDEANAGEGALVESGVGPGAGGVPSVDREGTSPGPMEARTAAPSAPAEAPPRPPRAVMQVRRKPITVASTPMIGDYQLPDIGLLHLPDPTVRPTETKEELVANARLMVQTLAQFGIEVAPGDITKGPTITRYELHPAPGVKLEKIAGLTNNIAAALKAERLNVLAPVPGKSSVGVEVPNAVKTKVIMRDLLESDEWRLSKARIPLALGKDVYGVPIIADLAEMPHVLIAGSTGSGKSVCINTIIASLLFRFTPDQLRFVMIDPKVVELQQYNALPHLVVPVVTDPKKVILALRWVVNEMEKRYQIFAKVGVRNIRAFNDRPKDKIIPQEQPELPLLQKKEKIEAGADGFAVEVDEQIVVPREEDIVIPDKLSYIVVIIDKLADLMLVAPADVEMAIARITQMARAAGIHCIVATQRPSVDVITGVIKANIPARIAFQVAAKVDSRTILDQMGADKLLGKGDMLYLPPGSGRLIRAQGALITDAEIEAVMNHISVQGKPSYEPEIHQALQKAQSSMGTLPLDPDDEGGGEDDEILQKCIDVIRSEKKASVSLLQRRLKLGYGRAARLMDELEDRGVVGPSKGAEPRDILLDLDGEGYDGGGQRLV